MADSSGRFPFFSTLFVIAAVGVMISLGIWQLGRSDEKARLIAHYEAALLLPGEVDFPAQGDDAVEELLYRRSRLNCLGASGQSAIAGRSDSDVAGWAITTICETPQRQVDVLLGWSLTPDAPIWAGGEVAGVIAPAGEGVRLQAMPPMAGLAPLAMPDPGAIPNNHLAYALQWFFFAGVAVLIYILALRKRLRTG